MGVDEEEGRLDLFLSIHTDTTPPTTVTRQQVEVGIPATSFILGVVSQR